MTTSGQQMLFDGRELQAVDVNVPGFGTKTLMQTGLKADNLHQGDEIEATVRYKVAFVNHGANTAPEGLEKAEFRRIYVLQPIKTSFKVTAHLSREDRESAWQSAHETA